jgi:dTDP-3-amino-3,4,6-trideoxy-alpha-D-glucopyranose N,N-dimethyltransferase
MNWVFQHDGVAMYTETALYYDKIYSFKDYPAETDRLRAIFREHQRSAGTHLLDVACGTGRHLEYLRDRYDVEGLDISLELLTIARQRLPGIPLHHGDMTAFDLGKTFDLVTCLFSSIGYVKTLENLARAVGCMARHLRAGGLLIIEPWFTPDTWRPGTVHAIFIDEPELKIARINTSFVMGHLSIFDLHYLVGTPPGTEHFVEHHEMGLFTTEDMRAALAAVGLEVTFDPQGLMGRGLFVGRHPG